MTAIYHGILNYYTFQHSTNSDKDTNNNQNIVDDRSKSLRLDLSSQELNIPKLLAGASLEESTEEAIKLVRLLILTSFIVDRRESNTSNSKRLIEYIRLVQDKMLQSQKVIIMNEIMPLLGESNFNRTGPTSVDFGSSLSLSLKNHQSGIDHPSDGRLSTTDTSSTKFAGSKSRASHSSIDYTTRQIALEQEISRLLRINEHQQAAINDLEEAVAHKQHILELLHYYSDSDDNSNKKISKGISTNRKSLTGNISDAKLAKIRYELALKKADVDDNVSRRKSMPSRSNKSSLGDGQSVIEDLENQVATLLQSNNLFQKTANDLSNQIVSLKSKDTSREKELVKLQQQYSTACNEISALRRTELAATRYRRKIEELQEEIEELETKNSFLNREKQNFNEDDGLFVKSEEISILQKNVEALQRALDDSRHRESQLLALLASFEKPGASKPNGAITSSFSSSSLQNLATSSVTKSNVDNTKTTQPFVSQGSPSNPNSTNSGIQPTSSSSAQSNKSVRPLIDHYEVLVKHAGFSAARWKVLMNRSSSGSFGTGTVSHGSGAAGSYGSHSIRSSSPSVLSSRRSSKDSTNSATSPVVGPHSKTNKHGDLEHKSDKDPYTNSQKTQTTGLNDKSINEVQSNSANTLVSDNDKMIGLGIQMSSSDSSSTQSEQEEPKTLEAELSALNKFGSDFEEEEPIKSQEDGSSIDTSLSIKPNIIDNNQVNDRKSEIIGSLQAQNEELQAQNKQLQEELELMASAWKSLAFKFQDLEDQHILKTKLEEEASNTKDAQQESTNEESLDLKTTEPDPEPTQEPSMESIGRKSTFMKKSKESSNRNWSWGSAFLVSNKDKNIETIKSPSTNAISIFGTENETYSEGLSTTNDDDENTKFGVSGMSKGTPTICETEEGSAIRALQEVISSSSSSSTTSLNSTVGSEENKQSVRIRRYFDAKKRASKPTHDSRRRLQRSTTIAVTNYQRYKNLDTLSDPTWLSLQRGRVIGYTYF